jgi:hypothetical protein
MSGGKRVLYDRAANAGWFWGDVDVCSNQYDR